MSTVSLDLEVRKPQGEHQATVIFLHGLGDNAHNFAFFYHVARESGFRNVKWIFPSAPVRRITANSGFPMPAWFDYLSFDFEERREDEPGLYQAAGWVKQLIQKEIDEHKIPPSKIAIGGFSQGGATTFLTALTLDKHIAGWFGLGTYVPLGDKVIKPNSEVISNPYIKTTPLFWGHGKADPLLNHNFALKSAKDLAGVLDIPFTRPTESSTAVTKQELEDKAKEDQLGLRFHSYEGVEHSIGKDEWNDFALWLSVVLKLPEEIKQISQL